MSWSGSVQIPKGTAGDDAIQAIRDITCAGNDDCPQERDAAVRVAKEAAEDLLTSDCFGVPEDHGWNVSISGHASPDNHSGDSVNVSLSRSG